MRVRSLGDLGVGFRSLVGFFFGVWDVCIRSFGDWDSKFRSLGVLCSGFGRFGRFGSQMLDGFGVSSFRDWYWLDTGFRRFGICRSFLLKVWGSECCFEIWEVCIRSLDIFGRPLGSGLVSFFFSCFASRNVVDRLFWWNEFCRRLSPGRVRQFR